MNPNYTTTTEIANVIVNAHSAYESIDIFSATDNIVGFLSQIGCVESPLGEVEKKINFEEIFINIDSNGGNSLIDHLHGKMPHREIVMEKVFDYLSE